MKNSPPQPQVEGTKIGFDAKKMYLARDKSLEAVRLISQRIQVGMTEDDAIQAGTQVLTEMGAQEFWHPVLVRFGINTLKDFRMKSEPHVRLGENDIYFIDIGPVWDGYEGDAGDTFVTGSHPEMLRCKTDLFKIFQAVKDHWNATQSSGLELYDYASTVATELEWKLNSKIAGHRLSDFPHRLYSTESLGKTSFYPSPNVWVLEIQIQHPTLEFGAFYEDLLF